MEKCGLNFSLLVVIPCPFTEHLLCVLGGGVLGLQMTQTWFRHVRAPILGLGGWEASRANTMYSLG